MLRRSRLHWIGVTVLVMLSISCTTFELEGYGAIAPSSVTGSETVHGSLYGFRWSSRSVEKCDGANLFRVEHHTNAVFLLTSVVTLGLYVPQTVEWWCTSPATEDADEEVWDPMENAIMDGGR